jgi:hypothetical protein
MNIADLFLQELAKDEKVSFGVRKLGKMLAKKHKSTLETLDSFARRQCEMWDQQDESAKRIAQRELRKTGGNEP